MRPLRNKIELSTESLYAHIKERGPSSLKELMLFFQGSKDDIAFNLFLGVQCGKLVFYPKQGSRCKARWGFNARNDIEVAGHRMSPLETKGELKYDLFSNARLATGFRRQ